MWRGEGLRGNSNNRSASLKIGVSAPSLTVPNNITGTLADIALEKKFKVMLWQPYES